MTAADSRAQDDNLLPRREPLPDVAPSPISGLDDAVWREIDALDDPSWIRREEATERLKNLEYDDDAIFILLQDTDRSHEQVYRLLQILRHRLLNRPKGAVGISMDTNTGDDVVVLEVIPGMPAEKVLRPGDHLLAVDGVAVRDSDHFGDLVKAKRPGETVDITFVRAELDANGNPRRDERTGSIVYTEEPRTEAMPLGNLNQLGQTWIDRHRDRQQRVILDAMFRFAPVYEFIPAPPGGSPQQPALSGRVDDYPAIRSLRNQVQLINRGEMVITPELQREWRQTIEQLTELMSDRSLTADERFFVVQVIQRYIELIPSR